MVKGDERKRGVIVNALATAVFGLVLTWIIMFKCNLLTSDLRFGYRGCNLVPFKGIAQGTFWVECVLNVAAFIPLGYLIAALSRRRGLLIATLVSFGLAAFYEAFQYILAFGSLDITDAICNGVGGVIGAVAYLTLGRRMTFRGVNVPAAVVIGVCVPLVIYAAITTAEVFPVYLS